MRIKIFYDEIKYRIKGSKNCLKEMEKVIRSEKRIPGDLSFILTNDEKMIDINREFLGHDYYTDVIAFSNNNGNIINGEIYISFDTVKRNSINYKVSLRKELLRVMIHGTLHLCGYDDKTKMEREEMRRIEDNWLIKIK